MNLYEYKYSKDILINYIQEQKKIGNNITYQSIADDLRMQKSYLSKITSGNAHFNKDQIYLLSQSLKLDEEQKDFLFLISDFERASINEYKDELEKKVLKTQKENTKSESYLTKEVSHLSSQKIQHYYLYPEIQLVHLSFGISKYRKDPRRLKELFNINDELFTDILKILTELNLVEVNKDNIKLLRSNMHLPKESPFFHQWQLQLKLKSLEWIKAINSDDKYNFTVSFTSDDNDKENIRLEFMKFLKKVEGIVKKSKSKNIYQMNFDLFKWD